MAFQPAICTSCGGTLQVDDTDLNGFCECKFCHTPHKVLDIITIDGLPTAKSLLMNASMCMDDGNAEKAVKFYQEVLKIKPNCHEAWWGLYLCNSFFDQYYGYKDKYGNSGQLTKAIIMHETIEKYASRAIEFAPPEQAKTYRSLIQSELDFIDRARNGEFDKEISRGGKSGCYIATAVYGSYSCRQVFALRKYRDDYLSQRLWGRAFIRVYYALSPSLAKHIRQDSTLGKGIRNYLDRKVLKLSAENGAVDRSC